MPTAAALTVHVTKQFQQENGQCNILIAVNIEVALLIASLIRKIWQMVEYSIVLTLSTLWLTMWQLEMQEKRQIHMGNRKGSFGNSPGILL